MSASQPSRTPSESPEVTALRKKARDEPLTETEQALLAGATRKPAGRGIPHEAVEAMLEERRQRQRG